jgi:hypothetical protein
MNKFTLILFFLLLVNLSKSEEKIDLVYEIITDVARGMSSTGEGKCAKALTNSKDKLLGIFERLKKDLENGKQLSSLMISYGIDLLGVPGMATDCKIMELITVYTDVTSIEGIKKIALNIKKNAEKIAEYADSMKNVSGLSNKMEYIGRILSLALNKSVN